MMSTIKRSEVPVQETWNLEDLFATETDYTAAIEDLKAFVDDAATSLEGSIADVNSAIKAIEVTEKIQEKWYPSERLRILQAVSIKQIQKIKCVRQTLAH